MAVISQIPASELAFENGNLKFLPSEIINSSAKKSNADGILGKCDTPYDFFQNCIQNFSPLPLDNPLRSALVLEEQVIEEIMASL